MFVQAPALLIQQRSENSEEASDEEGTGDVLQVERPSIPFRGLYFPFASFHTYNRRLFSELVSYARIVISTLWFKVRRR